MIWTKEGIAVLKEEDLCKKVLIPLFEAMGFQDAIYYHGGVLEQGKDIVMWKDEIPRDRINYAVVVKAERIYGNTSTGTILTQIKQSFGAPYIDKKNHEKCLIHHCIVVSSQEIKKEGTNTLKSLLEAERLQKDVTLIDGENLWNYVIDFTTLQGGTEEFTLTNDKQQIPFKIEIKFVGKSLSANINYAFNYDKKSIYWLFQALEFQRVLSKGAALLLREHETGLEIDCGIIPSGKVKEPNLNTLSISKRVLAIQNLTNTPIIIPHRDIFTPNDISSIEIVEAILSTGQLPNPPKCITVTAKANKHHLKNFKNILQRQGEEMVLENPMEFMRILETDIPLGSVRVRCRSVKVHPDDVHLLKEESAHKEENTLSVRLMAEGDMYFYFHYLQWPKKPRTTNGHGVTP